MASSIRVQRPIYFIAKHSKAWRQHSAHCYSSRVWSHDWVRQSVGNALLNSSVAPRSASAFPWLSGLGKTTRSYSVEIGAAEQTALIKQLRERTSAPMKDVKAALVNCNWDLEAAHTDLRKKGVVLASKKAYRTAAEGTLALAQDEKTAAVVEINCETDFVARNEIFQYLALSVARLAWSMGASHKLTSQTVTIDPKLLEEMKIVLDHPKLSGETTVQDAIMEVAAMMGENVKLRRGFTLSAPTGIVSSYLHTSPQPGLGRIAGLLALESEDGGAPIDVLQTVGSNLAMHIVAARPMFLSKDHVSAEALEVENDIIKSQAAISRKPQAAVEKMVEGRMRKYMEEVALLEQKFVMNDKVTVKSVVDDLSKEAGQQIRVSNFVRMEVGEGIQRQETSLAGEVEAQIG